MMPKNKRASLRAIVPSSVPLVLVRVSLGPLDAENRVEQQDPLAAPAVQVPGLGGRDAAAALGGHPQKAI